MKIYVWNTREYSTRQFHRKSVYYNITCISLSAIQVSKGMILIVDILANTLYYSFKIFPKFWLAKSTRIIHQNQFLMTKFGRILCLMRKWRQKCSLLQVNAPLTEKTWGWDWVIFVVKTKITDTSLVSRVRSTAGTRWNNG